jgi:hypothetical protein
MQEHEQGPDRLEEEVISHVGINRRELVRRMVAGTAFAVPVVASFDMASVVPAAAGATVAPPDISSITPNHGPAGGGTVVTISLSQAVVDLQAVHFGDTPATSFNGTFYGFTTTAVAPPGVGSVVVTVTNAVGTSSSSDPDAIFTYDSVATALVARPLLATGLHPTARLTRADTGAPIAGEAVSFLVGSRVVGTATTDTDGVARLGGIVLALGGFTAAYAGSDAFGASSAHGKLL